jgi:hypothetical protein
MNPNSKTNQFPKLVSDQMAEFNKTKSEFVKIKNSMTESILKSAFESFVNSGGCLNCNGRKRVVVWDTMDCMDGSYAEFGDCPKCTPETDRVGLNKTVYSKYDRVRGLEDPRPSLYGNMFDSLDQAIDKLNREINKLKIEHDKIEKGRVVCVVKGRKVPIGIVGKIFYKKTKPTSFGLVTTLGIKDKNQVVYWVNENNVELVFDQKILDIEEVQNGNELLCDNK